jgi:tetratricopeptide (TPR) repeat protein
MQQAPPAIAEALASFDEALRIRSRLPARVVPDFGYGLAACWLNRAEALMRLADRSQVPAAIAAFDRAIAVLRELPLADDARYLRRLAIALQNRGLAIAASGAAIGEVVGPFEDALAALPVDRDGAIDDRLLRGAILVNLAALLSSASDDPALAASRAHAGEARLLVEEDAHSRVDAAEIDLKARHIVCRAVAGQLSASAGRPAIVDDDVHDLTDMIEAGLLLVRSWEERGDSRFRDLARDLIRFGARVYSRFQPHFVNEFLEEHRDLDRA